MNQLKKNVIAIALAFLPLMVIAQINPMAFFGEWGIQYHASIVEYQKKYIGQTVKYIPHGDGGSAFDKKKFEKKGGKYNTEYTISDITGDNKNLIFALVEKNGKKKIKLAAINDTSLVFRPGEYYYQISNLFSIPLLLSDKFQSDRLTHIGKTFPQRESSPVYWEVKDMVVAYSGHLENPIICYDLEEKNTAKTMLYKVALVDRLNDLGKTYHNPKFKCHYTVIETLDKEKVDYKTRNADFIRYYVLKNSINGKTKEVKLIEAHEKAFEGDDAGVFSAALHKVEKPSNPAVKYGETVSVTEEGITKYSYKDNFIDITIFAATNDFKFVLENISDHTLKLLWNEAVFVDVNGSTSKVMHSGVRFSQRDGDQPASVIIKGAKLTDVVTPTDRVYYNDTFVRWDKFSLFLHASQKSCGKKFKLMLPIQVKDVTNEYIFEFEVKYGYKFPELIVGELLNKIKI